MSAVDVLGMSPAFVMGQGAAKKVLGQAEKYCKQWQLGMAGRGRGGQWPPKLLGARTPVCVPDACALGQRRCRALDELVAAADADKILRIAAHSVLVLIIGSNGNACRGSAKDRLDDFLLQSSTAGRRRQGQGSRSSIGKDTFATLLS